MKRKYIKGFLCRDASIGDDNDYWFYADKPRWNKIMHWFIGNTCSLVLMWDIKKFNEEYDCNFELPGKGEKIKCWLEVGDE